MNYKSTRGKAAEVKAAQAIVKGIAEDGGLFVPETIPAFSDADFSAMVNEDYRARAERIFATYLTDFTTEEIKDSLGEYKCISTNFKPKMPEELYYFKIKKSSERGI